MRRMAGRIPALGAVVLMLSALIVVLGTSPASAKVGAGAVRVSIGDVRPNSPALSNSPPRPLEITLSLTNTTDETLRAVTVSAARGDPITSQRQLDEAIAKPKPPSPTLVSPLKTTLTATLAPHSTKDLIYRTKTDIASDAELCLCADAIYPLYFAAVYTPAGGSAVQVGAAQTYLPSFKQQPAKARVGWLWPLLDRPHRLTSDILFTDDDLAAEVAVGGRLDRLLDVVEQVGVSVPLTLITDPELIDELAVMSTGYFVATSKGTVRGTGSAAAAAWLVRLRDALSDAGMELVFTPPADPAIESLNRNHLAWSATMSAPAEARITAALDIGTLKPATLGGQPPLTDISWPAGGTLSSSTLAGLVAHGAKTVVVSDKVLPRGIGNTVVPDALAPVRTSTGSAVAAITSSTVQRWVNAVLTPPATGQASRATGLAALPELVAELAIRVENSPDKSHYILITPSRDLTINDPDVAVRAILATSRTPWSRSLPLRRAVSTVTPVDHGPLRSNRVQPPEMPQATIDSLRYVTESLPGLDDLYVVPRVPDAPYTAARAGLDVLPLAVQRCESSSLLGLTARSVALAARLEARVHSILSQVNLVQPKGGKGHTTGSYTFTSANSKLPVTIVNGLGVEVQIRLDVTASGGPGFQAADVDRTVNANSTVQVHVPTHVDRVGRFDVRVTLSTRGGLPLGNPIDLRVRSTALGTVGVVITIVAGVVLALALVVRFIRRLSIRRRPKPSAPAAASAGMTTPT